MYRDNLEALQQRVKELDRALAACPAPPAALPAPPVPFPWKRLRIMVTWLGLGLLSLGVGLEHLVSSDQLVDQVDALRRNARETPAQGSPPFGVWAAKAGDRSCVIMLTAPCRATITCGDKVLYHGAGTCRDGRYVDPADSWLDGTPQCVVDLERRRAMVRDFSCHRKSDYDYPKLWQVDLELP